MRPIASSRAWAPGPGLTGSPGNSSPPAPAAADRPRTHVAGLDELTPQELQIARAVAGGKNNCEVSAALFVSRKTVEAHLTRIYRKLGIHSRVELTRVLLAARNRRLTAIVSLADAATGHYVCPPLIRG